MMSTKSILITGGTTFVSKYAAEYFVSKGSAVTVINRGSRAQVKGVAHINCDRSALSGKLKGRHFDLVLDIAAYTEDDIRALLASQVGFDDYIFISSSAVYPETNPQPFTEEQLCGRNSVWGDYGANKLKAEQYLLKAVPNAYVLRPPYLYGKYENLYREAFTFDCAMRDRPFYIPQNGDMKLQFFHVSDLCRFIEILIEKHPSDRIFNVGNRDTVSVKEWVGLCYKAAGKTAEFVSVDKDIPQREYFPFPDYEYALDVSKQNALMPDTVPLEQGLKEEFEWYKDNLDSVYKRRPYIEFIDNKLVRNGLARNKRSEETAMTILEACALLKNELLDSGYEYGFYLNGKTYKPDMTKDFDKEFFERLMSEYRVQHPTDTMRSKVGTCNDAVVLIRSILDKHDIPSKIWLLKNKQNGKLHTVLTFYIESKTVYLELTPQSGKPWYGKELVFDSEKSFVDEYTNDGSEVIDVTDSVIIGERPDFLLSRMV